MNGRVIFNPHTLIMMTRFASEMMHFYLFVSLSICMSSVLLLNDTSFYSEKLQNITNTNVTEIKYSLNIENYSNRRDFNVSDAADVVNTNNTVVVDSATDDSNDSVNELQGDLAKLEMLPNENKSATDVEGISAENILSVMTSQASMHSEMEIRNYTQSNFNNEANKKMYNYNSPINITEQNLRDEYRPKKESVIAYTKQTITTERIVLLPETKMNTNTDYSLTLPIVTKNSIDVAIKAKSAETTQKSIRFIEPTETVIERTVHHLLLKGNHHHQHNTMHHLSLVPIEDGPFGSLIWKDKKYLISVLIPIVIGIVGAACIIGMTYTVRYCQKYETKIREIRSTITHQTQSNNDQIVLLTDSSDEL